MQVQTPYQWAIDHIQYLSWPAVVVGTWFGSKWANKLVDRAKLAEMAVIQIRDNHIPHLQETVTDINENIKGLREDFRAYYLKEK